MTIPLGANTRWRIDPKNALSYKLKSIGTTSFSMETWQDMETWCKLSSHFCSQVNEGLLKAADQAHIQIELLSLANLSVRIAHLLLMLAKDKKVELGHQELADLLNVYRESTSVILSEFCKRNWIDTERKCIFIKNEPALRHHALAF